MRRGAGPSAMSGPLTWSHDGSRMATWPLVKLRTGIRRVRRNPVISTGVSDAAAPMVPRTDLDALTREELIDLIESGGVSR